MYQLRYYQEEAVSSVFDYFKKGGGNPVVALPTGTGKSVVIADIVKRACTTYPKTRVLMLTHVKELVEQNFEKLVSLWPTAPAGIYSAGLGRRDTNFPITFCGVGSIARRVHEFGFIDLVIVDECHRINDKASTMYAKVLAELRLTNPHVRVIGLTATPYRMGLGLITEGKLFDDICCDYTSMDKFNKLVTDGFLAPVIPKKTNVELDVSGVGTQGGEFIQSQLAMAVDVASVTKAALDETVALGHDRKAWLIFATSIEHAGHIQDMLLDLDIPTGMVHGKLTNKDRDEEIAKFKRGEYTAVVNVGVLTTGFDYPEIDLLVMLRPTKSPSLYIQIVGRGTRIAPGKMNCLVLDFAGNTARLGPINDPVLPKKKGDKGGGTAPVRVCDVCGTYNHASAKFCISCGHEFPRQVKIKTSASEEELIAKSMPDIRNIDVTGITYQAHTKKGGFTSLKVSYFVGIKSYAEWVPVENPKGARVANKWWNETCSDGSPMPSTVKEILDDTSILREPKTIKVWVNKEYPEIIGKQY